MATHFDGTLDITIHDAQLTLPQHMSKQDPYCVVTLGSSGLKNLMEGERFGKEKFQTKVHNGAGQHPVWNESQSLSLKHMTSASHLKVKVYDKDVGKDDYLGVAKVNLDELIKFDNKGVQYFPLHKTGPLGKEKRESVGRVGVAVKFNCTQIPHSDLKTGVTGTDTTGTTTGTGAPIGAIGSTTGAPIGAIGSTTGAPIGTTGAPMQKATGAGVLSGATGATGVTQPSEMNQGAPVTTFNGTIDITISDAKIMEAQHGSKQDPYCVVALGSGGLKSMMEGESLGKEKFHTKVHNGAGQHPIWNETHSLSLKNMKLDSYLEVRVYDKDVVKDDYIGIAKISLGDLLPYNKKEVQYFPLYKKGILRQTKSEEIGQVGVGVVFNCTEMPHGQADLKSQATDTVIRKDQQLEKGTSGPYQTAQTIPTHPIEQTQTVNQPLNTKPVHTQGTMPSSQGQVYGH
jgi:Ca2+-dependent lipid-binding protein